MSELKLVVLSLRYSSWSIRPWLALHHAGAPFRFETADVPDLGRQSVSGAPMPSYITDEELEYRRRTGSVTGLYPVLWVGSEPIHESLAICEWVAEEYPQAGLWPAERMARARARSVSAEMASSFSAVRAEMSCHVYGKADGFVPSAQARQQVHRVFELWAECLRRSGGPFLFGAFTIADCMYFPMLTRFRTYGVRVPTELGDYADALWGHPSVRALLDVARSAPSLPAYDAYLESVGGDPKALL